MVQPPEFIRKFFPSVTWRIDNNKRKVYLTFDDGPIPEVTPAVLDILKQYNVKATFFCIGDNVKKHPDIYERILTEGHRTGNHTQHHLNALKTSRDEYLEGISQAENYIDSDLFRPPYGMLTPAIINRIKNRKRIILWDVISYDFDTTLNSDDVYYNVIDHIRQGSIIVFHDSNKAASRMLDALPRVLDYIKENNYGCGLIM